MPYICSCGKECQTTSSFAGHCSHCKVHLGHEPSDNFGEHRSWNKGRTKETDIRIARAAERQKKAIADGIIPKGFHGRKHTEATKQLMSIKAKAAANEHRNGWKGGDSHKQNKYEKFTSEFLGRYGIEFEEEVTIPQSKFGKTGSYYQFDFLIKNRIDLEIDGTSHKNPDVARHDAERDQAVSTQYIVHRIMHNDNLDVLEAQLTEFLDMLNKM